MRFVIKDLGGKLKAVDLALSDADVERVKDTIYEETGERACLYFEDVRLWTGGTLSELIINMGMGTGEHGVTTNVQAAEVQGEGQRKEDAGYSSDSTVCSIGSTGSDSKLPDVRFSVRGFRSRGTGQSSDAEVEGAACEVRWPKQIFLGVMETELQLAGRGLEFTRRQGGSLQQGHPLAGLALFAVPGSLRVTRPRLHVPKLLRVKGLKPVCLLFPSENNKSLRMLRSVQALPQVQKMVHIAESVLGYDIYDIIMKGPGFRLSRTEIAQPAVFIAGLAAMEKLKFLRPEVVERASTLVGVGVGHYAALCAAGVLSFEVGLRLVKERAEAMAEASSGVRQLAAACVGQGREKLQKTVGEAAARAGEGERCEISAVVSPRLCIVAGTERAVLALQGMAKEAGLRQVDIVDIQVASETSLMQPALERLSAALDKALPCMRPPARVVWKTTSASTIGVGCNPASIVEDLKVHLTAPSQTEGVLRGIMHDGVTEMYELGALPLVDGVVRDIQMSRPSQVRWVYV